MATTTVVFPSTTTVAFNTTLASFISGTTVSPAAPGTFVFRKTNSSGAILTSSSVFTPLGNYTIYCAFTSSNTGNFKSSNGTKTVTVQKATPTITMSSLNSITYGTTMSGFITDTTASVAGSFTFRLNDASGQLLTSASVLNAATYTIFCAFTPTDTTNYNSTTATKSLTVSKLPTTVTMSSLTSITYGTTMSGFITGTTASVAGSFAFSLTDASGQLLTSATVLNAATYTIFCAFTPTDTTNYNSTTATKSLTVSKLPTTVTMSSISSFIYGTTMSDFISSTTASVAGSFTFRLNNVSGQLLTSATVLDAEIYTLFCAFTPTDATNYNSSTATTTLTVNTGEVILTYSIPDSFNIISYGTQLSSDHLCAVARDSQTDEIVTGKQLTYSFTPDFTQTITTNSILNSGTYYIFASFTDPSNNYFSADTSLIRTNILTVAKVKSTVTVPNVSSLVYGATMDSFITGTTQSVPGSLRFFTPQ